jgi:hypothetical protein
VAGAIWAFIKLPQEYWIHVAKLDSTGAVADHPWFGALCVLGVGVLGWLVRVVVRPRMPEPLPGWRLEAPAVPPIPPRHSARVPWSELAESRSC